MKMSRHVLFIFLLLALAPLVCGDAPADADAVKEKTPGGNGTKRLGAKRYDEVCYATTHNAMSNSDDNQWKEFLGQNEGASKWVDKIQILLQI